jgi:hypothetical protein
MLAVCTGIQLVERIAHKEETSLSVLRRALYLLSATSIALCIWTTVTMQNEVHLCIVDGDLTHLAGVRSAAQEVSVGTQTPSRTRRSVSS